jgi:hypothetical protein
LVDDDLRLDLEDAVVDGIGVECVENDWSGAETLDARSVVRIAEGSEDFMLRDEEWDKSLADGAGCAGEEYSHLLCLQVIGWHEWWVRC